MSPSHTFDAARAYQHITSLAFPRAVGSTGEAKAQNYIAEQLSASGLDVSRDVFFFSKFPAEVFPRLLCALFVLVVLCVPLLGERFPVPVCLICLLSLAVALFFTQWQNGLEGLYNIGRSYTSENIVATNGQRAEANMPALLFVAHYDSKSQVLPIAVRAAAYGISILGLVVLTLMTLLNVVATTGLSMSIVWSITGATTFCLLLLQINLTQNRSPGAFDNAAGVAVLLELARGVMIQDVKKSVTFLATGAEEYGMCGALRYMQQHAGTYNPAGTYVINLDGLGVGNAFSLVTRYGLPPIRTANGLASLFQTSAETLGIAVSERYLPIGVGLDSIPIASRGFETVTLTAKEVGNAAFKVHSKWDTEDILNRKNLQQAGELIVEVIRRL